jgi:hypothetical protein
VSALPDGWRALRSRRDEGGDPGARLIIAWWAGPDDAAVWVFADGMIEVDVAAPVEVVTLALAAYHLHAHAQDGGGVSLPDGWLEVDDGGGIRVSHDRKLDHRQAEAGDVQVDIRVPARVVPWSSCLRLPQSGRTTSARGLPDDRQAAPGRRGGTPPQERPPHHPAGPVLSFAQLAAALAVTERELEHVGPDGARQILRAHDEKARSR